MCCGDALKVVDAAMVLLWRLCTELYILSCVQSFCVCLRRQYGGITRWCETKNNSCDNPSAAGAIPAHQSCGQTLPCSLDVTRASCLSLGMAILFSCPGACELNANALTHGTVQGDGWYSESSSVCLAALHDGKMPKHGERLTPAHFRLLFVCLLRQLCVG
jgi:hypothetical protein